MSNLLIFPCTTELRAFYQFCQMINKPVVAATSVDINQYTTYFDDVVQLPYIYQTNFIEKFLQLIEDKEIDTVYSPVTSVHAFLKEMIANKKLNINFISRSPIEEQELFYSELFYQSEQALKFINVVEPKNKLSTYDIAAIIRQADLIYGESNNDKIQAMMAIFASAPKGDVVEIGSLMGRTAFVLCYLSNYYQIGAVLAVDPWSESAAVQKDSPDLFQKTLPQAWDCELLAKAFITNLLSVSRADFNYLRMTSEDGYHYYGNQCVVSSEVFGETRYSDKIAVIHIDGNHDYKFVKQDCELWLSKLVPGAWLILDDYIWAHGDGPKCIGDELLFDQAKQIMRSFVCGKALFIQFY